jgi:hypothetical protein
MNYRQTKFQPSWPKLRTPAPNPKAAKTNLRSYSTGSDQKEPTYDWIHSPGALLYYFISLKYSTYVMGRPMLTPS